jgi:hypothetical protein
MQFRSDNRAGYGIMTKNTTGRASMDDLTLLFEQEYDFKLDNKYKKKHNNIIIILDFDKMNL